jgi:hypothetical protein
MRDQQLNALGPLVLEHAPNVDRLETYYLQVIVMDYPRFAEESSSHHQNHSTKNVRDFRGLKCPPIIGSTTESPLSPATKELNLHALSPPRDKHHVFPHTPKLISVI